MNPNQTNNNNALPADFDGVFRFTNWTDDVKTYKWGGIAYTFQPNSTSPLVIPGATPEEVQHIRKKFARELAIEEFYKTPNFVGMNATVPGGVPALYTDSDLTAFIQKCLEPLPMVMATPAKVEKVHVEDNLRKDEEGNNVTKILDKKKSLLQEGSGIVA